MKIIATKKENFEWTEQAVESLPKWFTSKFTSAEQYIVLPNYLILTND